MSSFLYTNLERSIEDTSFEYISNLDDYKALSHILDVIIIEKIKKPIIQGVFQKISKLFKKTIDDLTKMVKSDGRSLEISKLESYIKSSSKKIILVRNENYNSFASYAKGFEDGDKIKTVSNKTVFYNVGQLETSGSISVVPTNANVFLSSLLYAYTLLFSDNFYSRQSVDVLIQISKIFYTVVLGSFGKKSGLLVGSRKEKEILFFLVSSFVYSLYGDKESPDKMKNFLQVSASTTGSSHFKEYINAISNADMKKKGEIFNSDNFDSLFKLSHLCKNLGLMEVSESEMKVQWFRLLSVYGVMALENYARLVAYIVATYIPNSYFTSTLKVYNKASYEYLVEYYAKELFSY